MANITVIVPVYLVEPYLHRCVDSILSQTYRDFDLILIDDGSPDCCGAICDEYAGLDCRVHVIHQENQGLAAARNCGIDWAFSQSDSQWLTFVDSDDWLHPMYLEALLETAEKYGIAITSYKRIREGNLPNSTRYSVSIWKTSEFYIQKCINAVVAWGKMYRKRDFVNIRFPAGRMFEDEATTYKLLFKYDKVPCIIEPLYGYYLNKTSITAQKWTPKKLDAIEIFDEQITYFIKKGLPDVAKEQLKRLFYKIHCFLRNIDKSETLTSAEKRRYTRCLRREIRKKLRQYKPHIVCSLWNRGDELWAYSDAYIMIRLPHTCWRWTKRILRKTQGQT